MFNQLWSGADQNIESCHIKDGYRANLLCTFQFIDISYCTVHMSSIESAQEEIIWSTESTDQTLVWLTVTYGSKFWTRPSVVGSKMYYTINYPRYCDFPYNTLNWPQLNISANYNWLLSPLLLDINPILYDNSVLYLRSFQSPPALFEY